LKSVPLEERNYDICLKFLNNNYGAFKFIPKDIIDKKMCMLALEKGISIIKIPYEYRDKKAYEYSIKIEH
jgi:hypothetical protein